MTVVASSLLVWYRHTVMISLATQNYYWSPLQWNRRLDIRSKQTTLSIILKDSPPSRISSRSFRLSLFFPSGTLTCHRSVDISDQIRQKVGFLYFSTWCHVDFSQRAYNRLRITPKFFRTQVMERNMWKQIFRRNYVWISYHNFCSCDWPCFRVDNINLLKIKEKIRVIRAPVSIVLG